MQYLKLGVMFPRIALKRFKAGFSSLWIAQGFLLGGVCSAATPSTTDIAVRQAESLKQQQALKNTSETPEQPPETYPGENADLGPQMLLKAKKKRPPLVEFSSDTMLTWTSNALSEGSDPKKAGIVAETFSLVLTPPPLDLGSGKLSLRTGYRHLFWMYDAAKKYDYQSLNGNNFEMSTVFLGGNYSFAENWNASLGLDFNRIMTAQGLDEWRPDRLVDPSKWSEVYVEWNPNWGLSRNIPLGDKLNLTLSYSGGYHFTSTDPNPQTNSADKLDNNLSASLSYPVTDTVMVQTNVRFYHSLYTQPQTTESHRRDWGLAPGLTVMWTPSPRIALRWSVSGDFRRSNDQDLSPNSSKFDASTGVTVTLKF